MKVGILGLPSTGKTTLARAFAGSMHSHFRTIELIQEFAREYLAQYGFPNDVWEQYLITSKQIGRERSIKADLVITDSPVILGLLYARSMYHPDRVPNHPVAMSELYQDIIAHVSAHPYDLLVVLDSAVVLVPDGVRPGEHLDPEWRARSTAALDFVLDITQSAKKVLRVTATDMGERIELIKQAMELENGHEHASGTLPASR